MRDPPRPDVASAETGGAPRPAVPGGSISSRRRLAAILVADVVGYTRLMHVDEDGTHARLMRIRTELADPEIARHGGQLMKNTGDGFVAIFDSTRDAASCAIELQRAVSREEAAEPRDRQISFRMGVNIADVIVEVGDVFGDGVNIAARLQSYAEPGGIIVTGAVVEQAGEWWGVRVEDLGDLPLRNLAHPVRAYGLRLDEAPSRPAGEATPGLEGRPSIVVLPFRANEAGDEYFAEGIVDDIVHGLSGLKELFVISRGSSLDYRGPAPDIRRIGRELGVRYVLHGGVRRDASRIRIRTELCDAETGAILYADRHDGAPTNLFELQSSIGKRVVSTIAPHVRERERRRAMRKHPQNLTAYDFVLQALDPLFGMDYPSFSLARGLLQKAIGHDPDYAPAYSYVAYWHLLRVGQGWSPDPIADTQEAAKAASSAIERDGNDPLALAIFGHVHSYLLKDYETAVELQERAIELGPNCAMAWTLSSATRGYLGEGPTAVLRADYGLQLSPRGPHVVYHQHILSQAHYINGNYDEAVRWGQRAAKQNDGLTSNLRCLAAALVATGQLEEARHIGRRLMELDPGMRLTAFARQTPLQGRIRDDFVERLRAAGLPE